MKTKQSVLSPLIGKTVAILDDEKGYRIIYPSVSGPGTEYIIIGVREELLTAKDEDDVGCVFHFSIAHISVILIEEENQ